MTLKELFPIVKVPRKPSREWWSQRLSASFLWPKDNPIHVSDFLERKATPEQKSRKIDIVDYLLER